nr:hypothetical protein Iba_chr14bCG14300 [Ipomoea batatas]
MHLTQMENTTRSLDVGYFLQQTDCMHSITKLLKRDSEHLTPGIMDIRETLMPDFKWKHFVDRFWSQVSCQNKLVSQNYLAELPEKQFDKYDQKNGNGKGTQFTGWKL